MTREFRYRYFNYRLIIATETYRNLKQTDTENLAGE